MFPHDTMRFGRGETKSRIVVRMSKYHDNAIRCVVAGSEPSFHELGANTSTLIGWEYYIGASPKAALVGVSDVIVTGLKAM